MKEHAKKALKHDTKVLGKTVPTMIIIGLFLVGGGSAALLATYGTVSGTAQVDQAVVLNDESAFNFNGAQTAGETVIETRTLESNANVSTKIGFETTCSNSTETAATQTGNSIDWSSGGCTGIDTQYVEYFDDAGRDSDYSPSVSQSNADLVVGSGKSHTSIGSAIAAASGGDVIFVKDGTYGDSQSKRGVLVNKSLTIVSENGPSQTTIEGHTEGVYITAQDVTLEGFTVTTTDPDQSSGKYGETGVRVEAKADGLVVRENVIEDLRDEHTVSAIGIDMSDGATGGTDVLTDGVTISNNLIQNVSIAKNNIGNGDDREAYVISFNERVNNADITQNTIRNVGGDYTRTAVGVTLFEDGSPNPRVGPQNFEVKMNRFSNFQAETASNAGSIFVGGYENLGSNHNVTHNVLEGGLQRYSQSQNGFDPASADTLNAPENFFSDGIQTTGDVSASWKEKSDKSIEAETTDEFGVVNEFAINLVPDSYSLTTSITPAGAEETPS